MSSNKAKLAFIKALGKATGDEQRISHDLAVLGVEALQKEALEAHFEENEVRDLMPKDQGFDKFMIKGNFARQQSITRFPMPRRIKVIDLRKEMDLKN